MTLYCVSLSIKPAIWSEYRVWLNKHIEQMLELPYFLSAKIYQLEDFDTDDNCIEVQYSVVDRSNLETYFKTDAKRMREEAISKFSGGFTATRRILHPVHLEN